MRFCAVLCLLHLKRAAGRSTPLYMYVCMYILHVSDGSEGRREPYGRAEDPGREAEEGKLF